MTTKDGFTPSKSRFESFSDGVFAIAITLLILEIQLPGSAGRLNEHAQVRALLSIWPQYLVYAATFATVGIMWLNHHAIFRYIERITHGMIVSNLLLLALICFLPFATEVIAQLGFSRVSVVYYGIALTAISFSYLLLQRQILAAHPSCDKGITLWNLVGLALYPVGTLIGYFVPILGIIAFALVAVFYMLPSNVESAAIHPRP